MAQLIGQQELDENGNPKTPSSGPQPITGPSPITQPSTSGGAPQAAPSQQAPAPKGSGFTDIGKIKRANVGADVGLAKAATQGIQQNIQSGMQQLGDMWKNYSGRIQSQQVAPLNKQKIQELTNKAASGEQLTPDEQKEITKYTQFQYKGPTSIEGDDASQLATQQAIAANARKQALLTLGRQGRRDLLTQGIASQGQPYTQGMSRLDELFLGGKGARGVLGQLRGQTAAFEQEASGLGSKVSQAAKAAKAAGEAADVEATGIVEGGLSNILSKGSSAKTAFAATEKKKQDAATGLENLFSNPNITEESVNSAIQTALDAGIIDQTKADLIKDLSLNPDAAKIFGKKSVDGFTKAYGLNDFLGGGFTAGTTSDSDYDYLSDTDLSSGNTLSKLVGGKEWKRGASPTAGNFNLDTTGVKNATNKALQESNEIEQSENAALKEVMDRIVNTSNTIKSLEQTAHRNPSAAGQIELLKKQLEENEMFKTSHTKNIAQQQARRNAVEKFRKKYNFGGLV
jgi:hypothetical protein